MKKIIALGGSNSNKSINKRLAIYVAKQIENVEVIVVDLNDFKLPLYGVDEEMENGIHKEAIRLNNLIESSDGLVLSLAEHNGSYSAAFKNIFDWLSRINQNIWKDKPMFLLSTSPGERGGGNVLKLAKSTFSYFGGNIIADFSLPSFNDNFSEEGLIDKSLNKDLIEKISIFNKLINIS